MSLTKRGTAFLVKEEVVENVTNVLRIYLNKKREQKNSCKLAIVSPKLRSVAPLYRT